ncbi:hypothetical protein FFF34_008570 [Inquilinus sp. KBS0705]|nr:hypothetical protein FFF34_008570 [Inquilinus sp. KBS0705]
MTDSDSENYINKATSLIPLLTIILLIFGATKQFSYYTYFNLNIFSYLELTELLPQTLFSFFQLLFYWLVSILITAFFNQIFYAETVKYPIILPPERPERIGELKAQISKVFWKIIIVVLALTLLTMGSYYYSDILYKISKPLGFINKAYFHILVIVLITIVSMISLYQLNLRVKFFMVSIPISLALITSGFFEGNFEYNQVHSLHTHSNYYIKIGSNIIKSSNSYYYIGKTRSSVFYYNEKTDLVTVYPSNLITEMVLGSD